MIKPVTSILAAALLSLSATISAAVTLPSVLSDGVVLQREQPIKIWGKALPGEQVTVKLKSSKAKTVADDSGKWSVTLSPLKAGGPYVLTVNDISVNDVLIGDIYLCSGQSNMELMVSRVMDFYADEVESYTNPAIREFKTPKEYAFHGAKDDVSKSEWKKVEPGKVKNFGALVYFIAKHRDLDQRELHGQISSPPQPPPHRRGRRIPLTAVQSRKSRFISLVKDHEQVRSRL